MTKSDGIEYPKIIDYACGAGHFLTEGYEAVEICANAINNSTKPSNQWVEKKIFGIEKDYRLARVSKISLFMHGAGDGNIIFGDGLENYPDKEITPKSFDILVANPPYSVKAFKPHLKLLNNQLEVLDKISNDGSEIETLFVERISQLLKPNGVAAVILPSSILNKESESFVTARESLLKNFNIIAIATLGSKTFGATGTNTVILFLQKFNEPPKRTDMVIDSVDAILSKADIDGWEDESILRAYLKKIGVKKDVYNKFLYKCESFDFWINDNYFSQHYYEFVNSTEYNKKCKQKSFQKLSNSKQKKWLNKIFYEFAFSIEQEKLFYYSLVYNQDTLIISAPDENKEQEKFLGYKWSNRKGQEGIQIIKAGGYLYNASNRRDNNSIAGLIRNAFSDEDEFDVEDLDSYYYRLRLQDMLDFSGTTFNKSIKTTPTRVLKDIPGLTNYKLSDKNIFELSIGNRVLSNEIVKDGSVPIYSANVFEEFGRIDKQNITDFSVPSILWGIDGDWMVNIIPANKPFYPTDHCGVLRIKTDDILPEYMAFALQVEGEFERFSRSNRASTRRISNLIIQVPSVIDQRSVVDEIEAVDKKISDEQAIITKQSEKVKSKFVKMFGKVGTNPFGFEETEFQECCIINPTKPNSNLDINVTFLPMELLGTDGTIKTTVNKPYTELKSAGYTYFEENDVIFAKITPCMENGKGAIAVNLKNGIGFGSTEYHILRPIYGISNSYWIYYLTSDPQFRENAAKRMTGASGHRRVPEEYIKKYMVSLPPIDLQNQFADYAQSCDELKFEAQKRLEELNTMRKELIDKHFR